MTNLPRHIRALAIGSLAVSAFGSSPSAQAADTPAANETAGDPATASDPAHTPPLPPGCSAPVSTADLQVILEDSALALSQLDIQSFRTSTSAVREALPCVREPIPRHFAAEVHRILGLRAFGERDPSAPVYFAAARSVEPAYRFPDTLIPKGSPIHASYDAFDVATGTSETLPPPAVGYLQFDGRATLERPATWPTLVQFFDDAGGVSRTFYLVPEEPMPEYEPWTGGPVETWDGAPPPPPSTAHRAPLLASTGATFLASGVLLGLALHGEHRYEDLDEPVPDSELPELRARTNALGTASALLGGAALVFGITVAVTW